MIAKNTVEEYWEKVIAAIEDAGNFVIPYFRRLVRLLALPYCFFILINWDECKVSRRQVVADLLYIFFKLKYFPDNYSLCRLWEKDRSRWTYYYGSNYDPYQRRQLRKEVQNKEYEILFEDKNICYQLCKAGGLPLPKQYCYAERDKDLIKALESCLNLYPNKKFIIKPVRGRAGRDIYLAYKKNEKILIRNNQKIGGLDSFWLNKPSVLQEYLVQHKMPSMISFSVNTVRIATLLTRNNDVLILGALMRFGVGDAFVDNTSQGGIGVGIDVEEGCLMKFGFDFKSRVYEKHPTSKVKLFGLKVPFWNEIVALSKKTQHYFCYFKLLGHDIAISENGPLIIELNAIYDNVGLEQKCGPILENRRVLEEYANYDLLINDKQKALLKQL